MHNLMIDTSDCNEKALAAEHATTVTVNDAGASIDSRAQTKRRLSDRDVVWDVAGADTVDTEGEAAVDVCLKEEEDAASTDVDDSTTHCCALLESSCFALALVVIGMVMGTLLPSPTLADAAAVSPTYWQESATAFSLAANVSGSSAEVGCRVARDQTIGSLTGLEC